MESLRSGAPRLTVLLPVHDAERFLPEAVESVLAQSFRDFELLAIDDGSRDASAEILGGFARSDRRVRVVHRPHQGLIATLNEGLALARGELIARMDADDVALPERFERQVAELDRDPALLCIGGAYQVIDDRGRRIDAIHRPCDFDSILESLLSGISAVCHATATYRRSAVISAGRYDASSQLAEDYHLWLRLAEKGRLGNLPEEVLRVRLHERSESELHHALQLDQTRRICTEARLRRGLPPLETPLRPWRAMPGAASRQQHLLGVCRSAWRLGERRTAIAYALRAVAARPLSPWLLRTMGHELLRRLPRRGAPA
jgi:glycosyltransferase involved in cell wall biosynthesis